MAGNTSCADVPQLGLAIWTPYADLLKVVLCSDNNQSMLVVLTGMSEVNCQLVVSLYYQATLVRVECDEQP